MGDFYGKIIGCKVYPRLVRIVDGDIYYVDATHKQVLIGLCTVPNDELHIARRTNNCIRLDNIEGTFSIESVRAGRSKKDEIWHRWASLSEHERAPYLQKTLASATSTKPRIIAKFHNPIGVANITGITIFRPSTNETFRYGDAP